MILALSIALSLLPAPKEVSVSEGISTAAVTNFVPLSADHGEEEYLLQIDETSIMIASADDRGRMAALNTLDQLTRLSEGKLPRCKIHDWPTYRWRGFMHDCGRNFLAKKEIFRLLDLMALYKLNLFHWHLTDYYGWRLESKKHPMLQAPWAFRRNHGLFYTQEDFREVVAYAKERGITVMPEIDVPGHTLAFRRGLGIDYMSRPEVKGIVSELLEELCSLVPAKDMPFVHLGTDEARTPYEMVPDSFCPAWAETIRLCGRTPVVWTPGKAAEKEGEARAVRMVWHDHYTPAKGEKVFDAVRGYFGGVSPFSFLQRALFSKPLRYDIPEEDKLGYIICSWHDDCLGSDTARIWTNNNFALAIAAYASQQWSGRSVDRPEFLVKSPAPGSKEFEEEAAFEEALVMHRDRIAAPLGLPFPYVRQTGLRFRISDENGTVVATDVAQAHMVLSDCGRHKLVPENSYLQKTQGVASVETWIRSPKDQTIGAWIGFTAHVTSGGRTNGTAEEGEWSWSRGTLVEVNGVRIPAPKWEKPGLKYVMQHPEEPSSNNVSETPFTNEEYFMRPPTPIALKAGWNHVKLTVTKTEGDLWKYNWLATFAPVTIEKTPREVPGLEFSAVPR